MQPLGIHHVSLNVSDVPEAISFYVEQLGGSLRDDRPNLGIPGAWIDLGAQQLHLVEGTPPAALGQHLAISVTDLDAVVSELRQTGLEIGDPFDIGTGRQTFVNDPAGNAIEIREAALEAES